MTHPHEQPRTGRFRWNRGGWFGAQVGVTLWIAILGCQAWEHSRILGATVLALAILPNVLGLVLWCRRDQLAPYPALQLLIAATGVAGLLSLLILWRSGGPIPLYLPWSLWLLLIYPGLMLVFHIQERDARKATA